MRTTKTRNDRVSWIDCAKGIGIFLVVLGHIYKENSILIWIYSFHMPLFFLLSGWTSAMFKPKGYSVRKNFISKSKSLLLPFVVFRCLLVAYWFVIERHFRELDLGPIWFLVTLYVTCITILPVLRSVRTIRPIILMTAVNISLYYIYIEYCPIATKETMHLLLWVLASNAWFSIGFLAKNIAEVFNSQFATRCVNECYRGAKIVLLIISAVVSVGGYKLNGEVSVFSGIINNYVLYLLLGLAGSCLICVVCNVIFSPNRFLEYWGRNAIILLAIHEPIKRVVLKSFDFLLHKFGFAISYVELQTDIIGGIVIASFVVILSYFVGLAFRYAKFHTGFIGNYVLSFIK